MASPADVLKDDKFWGLPTQERVKVLSTLDPNFGGLAATEQLKVVGERPAQKSAFQRFAGALGEGNPLSMQHGTPEEMAQRVGRPLSEQLGDLNPLNMVRGVVQPIYEMATGKVAEGTGHLIGGMGSGAPRPAGLRSPVTVGEPVIPRPQGIMSRYTGTSDIANAVSDASRIKLRSPIAPWEPPKTPVTPMSPRFKGKPILSPPEGVQTPAPKPPATATAATSQPTTPPPGSPGSASGVDFGDIPAQYQAGAEATAKGIAANRLAKVTDIAGELKKAGITRARAEAELSAPAKRRQIVSEINKAKGTKYSGISDISWKHILEAL